MSCERCRWPVAIPSALQGGPCQPCRIRDGEIIRGHRLAVEPKAAVAKAAEPAANSPRLL